MNRKSSISFGPGASSLILIFVVLAMSVLGMLSLMNSRSDIRLSERSVKVTEAVYALQAQAEETRRQLDELIVQSAGSQEALASQLPEGAEMQDGVIAWQESDGVRTLDCALCVLPPNETARSQWVRCCLIAETGEEW